jgi:3-oxoacyl-[acyl-carrier protein] reductase
MKKNKTVIITGCNGSIGSHLINYFKKKNYKIIGIDKKKINDKSIIFYLCDLNNTKKLEKIYKEIKKKYQFANCLINCAGLIHNELMIKFDNGFKTHSILNWKNVIENNINITFYNTKFFIDNFSNQKTPNQLIINFSSTNANGVIGQSAYSTSKVAIETATKVWSKELSIYKIRVTCISPGYINLDSTIKNISQKEKNNIINQIPAGRFGKIKEIISGINFIINNKYFNGKVLKIDGGK